MRHKGELGIRAIYARYKLLGKDVVELPVFVRVVEDFNQKVNQLLLNGQSITLPFNMGWLSVEKKKVNFEKLKLDYGHWRASGGEKIYHTNRHSDGYHSFFFWKKMGVNVAHKHLFRFVPARTLSRTLASIMKTEGGHTRYPAQLYVPKTYK